MTVTNLQNCINEYQRLVNRVNQQEKILKEVIASIFLQGAEYYDEVATRIENGCQKDIPEMVMVRGIMKRLEKLKKQKWEALVAMTQARKDKTTQEAKKLDSVASNCIMG